uniref:Large ribosomal subunit protein uL5 n=1 Tax=Candidatus Kentrum sp. MB TaxID=2138164 RepID=A0A450XH69_9GAMM|nr:MAG: LSU ribosomal protein L5P [Candidatus Kentron sp. MB]VFK32245.1 MAG: LSU ribosomal protein L5P [Candidatus Kentron sp. MB]VFK75770.1 MAG: LSU ribosomal protein L5P [Candidatus Kentron sp. MB]
MNKVRPRLEEIYYDEIVSRLKEQFHYQSVMQVPRITKITLNMGVGEAISDKKILDNSFDDLEKIAGQKPIISKACKSVAAFKVRQGWPIGCKVTLRRRRMYEFLDRLISIAIPRIRDFRGFSSKAFDGRGNYNLGLREQIVFPEIDYDKVDAVRGLNIAITTSAVKDEEGYLLLLAFGFPFR